MSKLNDAVVPLVDKEAVVEFVDVVEIDVAVVNCFSIFLFISKLVGKIIILLNRENINRKLTCKHKDFVYTKTLKYRNN